MRVLGMVAENYKRLKLIEIGPNGRMVIFSGKPDQGKTSCVDAFLSAIGGKRSTQAVPVRRGAKNAKIKLLLGSSRVEWTVARTIRTDGTHDLLLTDASGRQQGRGQGILDELHGDIWMDPTELLRMKPKDQIEILRKVVKFDLDVDRLNVLNKEDFEERTAIGREVRRLEAELATMPLQEGLPAEKMDESGILTQLAEVGSKNDEARRVDAEKAQLQNELRVRLGRVEALNARVDGSIAEERRLEAALLKQQEETSGLRKLRETERQMADEANQMVVDAPAGEFADVTELTEKLQEAQLINREIDKQQLRVAKAQELEGKRREVASLTRAMDERDEHKAGALASAKMPVEGLTFDEDQVLMRGIPLAQLGDSEQIRICTRIAMAENPVLRVLPIMHGESLGESGIQMLYEMAEEFDFQILMAMVDDSGKRGYVIEDGMVARDNDAPLRG